MSKRRADPFEILRDSNPVDDRTADDHDDEKAEALLKKIISTPRPTNKTPSDSTPYLVCRP